MAESFRQAAFKCKRSIILEHLRFAFIPGFQSENGGAMGGTSDFRRLDADFGV